MRSGARAKRLSRARRVGASFVIVSLAGVALWWVLGPGSSPFERDDDPEPVGIKVPSSIDASGEADVTKALNEFLTGVPEGSAVVFGEDARYRVEGTLLIQNRQGLTLGGNGATIVAVTDGADVAPPELAGLGHRWPRHRTHLYVRDSSDIVIRDLAVRGANEEGGSGEEGYDPDLEAQHGIELFGVTGALVEGCEMSYIYGDGVYVGGGSTDVTVTGCDIHHTGRQGMSVTSGERITFADNDLDEIRRSAFDLEPNTDAGVIRDVNIVDNVVGTARLNFVAGHGAGAPFNDITIAGNHLEETALKIDIEAPVGGPRRTGIVISDNTSHVSFGADGAPISLTRTDDVAIRENEQALDPGRSGLAVESRQSCGITLEANSFPNAELPLHRSTGQDRCPGESKG